MEFEGPFKFMVTIYVGLIVFGLMGIGFFIGWLVFH